MRGCPLVLQFSYASTYHDEMLLILGVPGAPLHSLIISQASLASTIHREAQ